VITALENAIEIDGEVPIRYGRAIGMNKSYQNLLTGMTSDREDVVYLQLNSKMTRICLSLK